MGTAAVGAAEAAKNAIFRRGGWVEAAGVGLVLAPLLYLLPNRGGTVVESQAPPLFLLVYAGLLLFALADRARAPWALVLLTGWPALQLVPLPLSWIRALSPSRAAELVELARQGVGSPATLSVYPYATVRSLLALGSAAALFVITRETCRRNPRALYWTGAAVLALALAEAVPALR